MDDHLPKDTGMTVASGHTLRSGVAVWSGACVYCECLLAMDDAESDESPTCSLCMRKLLNGSMEINRG